MIKSVFLTLFCLSPCVQADSSFGRYAGVRMDEVSVGPSLENLEGVFALSVRSTSGQLKLAGPHQFLEYGDTFLTGKQGILRFAYEQGVQILVAPHSSVRILEERGERDSLSIPVLQLDEGEIRALVEKNGENYMNPTMRLHRFFVVTPSAIFGARGTDFVVQADPLHSRVHVLTGAVDVALDRAALSRAELSPVLSGETLQQTRSGPLDKALGFDVKPFLEGFYKRNPRFEVFWRSASVDVRSGVLAEKFHKARVQLTQKLSRERGFTSTRGTGGDNSRTVRPENQWHHR